MSTTTALDLVETCARRGIERVVHCHADHFEPEEVARRFARDADVALWMERCAPAIPTLFVKPPHGFRLDATTETGVRLRPGSYAAVEADYLRALVALGAGVGLHIHHEAWTRNGIPDKKLSAGQRSLHDLAKAQNDSRLDHARMAEMVRSSLEWLRSVTGLALDEWHFVHGCWAFGASDAEICTLEDELPLLYSLGCRADFSFPAGRRHCDPSWDRPKWVVPASGRRAFEAGDPRDFYAANRMLVWASSTDAWWCGLDTYSADSKRLTESTDKIERYLALCPVVSGTAYVKTCGHGMNAHYWPRADDPQPTLGAFARELVETCERARIGIEFTTTERVVAELRAA